MRKGTCSIDGCMKAVYARQLCGKHYARLKRHGDPTWERPPRPTVCSVDRCERPVAYRSWCKMHYSRWWEGRPMGTADPVHNYSAACSVEGCDGPHRSAGYCMKHYERWRKYGDPHTVLLVHGGDAIGYGSAHDRVRRRRGSARKQTCAHCGGSAHEWAYDHSDPNEKSERRRPGGTLLPYSVDPQHYLPLCRKCHWRFDRPHFSAA